MIKSLILLVFLVALLLGEETKQGKKTIVNVIGVFHKVEQDQTLLLPKKLIFEEVQKKTDKQRGVIHLVVGQNHFTYNQIDTINSYYRVEDPGKTLKVKVKKGEVISFNFSEANIKSEYVYIKGEVDYAGIGTKNQ